MDTNNNIFKNTISAILVFVPIVVLLYIFNKYAINIPHWDDHPLKSFVLKFDEINSIKDKILLIFSQHNEHRIGLTRLFTLINFKLSGNIDFKFLIWVGLSFLFGILLIFYIIFKKYNLELKYFIPISFILIGVYPYENLFWAMASIQNIGVVFIAILCFYLVAVAENKTAFYILILLTFLGVFTSGNGVLIPIICSLILLLKRQFSYLFAYFLLSGIFVFFYFNGYQKPGNSQLQLSLLTSTDFYKAVMAMVGASIDLSLVNPAKRIDASMVVGVFLMLFTALLIWQILFKKYNTQRKDLDVFWAAILLFSFGTILATSLGRLNYGVETLLTSKYKIYSVLMLCAFYAVALNSFDKNGQKRSFIIALVTSIGLWYYGYLLDYLSVVTTRQDRLSELFNGHSFTDYPYRKVKLFTESVEKLLPNIPAKDEYDFWMKESENGVSFESMKNFDFNVRNAENGVYLLLKSEKKSYLYPLYLSNIAKKDLVYLISEQDFKAKYSLNLPTEYIDNGKYQLIKIKILGYRTEIEKYSKLLDIQSIKKVNPKQNW